jgi:hypothetical protein
MPARARAGSARRSRREVQRVRTGGARFALRASPARAPYRDSGISEHFSVPLTPIRPPARFTETSALLSGPAGGASHWSTLEDFA